MTNTFENTNKHRSTLVLAVSIASGALVLGGLCALVYMLFAQRTATAQLAIDTQIEAGLLELARAESQQFRHSQEILAVYDRPEGELQQRRDKAAIYVGEFCRQIDEQTSHVAQIAQSASSEHHSYESLVEELMLAGSENQEFVDDVRTLQRLSEEGRFAEAEQFAQELRSSCDHSNNRHLALLGRFQTSVLDRLAEHHQRERASWWFFLSAIVPAITSWVVYFRHLSGQRHRELVRSRAVRSPRADHLNVVRAQRASGNEDDLSIASDKPLVGCRVMAAEDGPHNQQFIKRVLAKAGAEVVIAANGDDATKLIFAANKANEPFDVVLMDMQMPVMDGFEATKTLRRFQYQGPIVAISAQTQSSDREQCLEAGCDGYLAKPINRSELVAVVVEYFSRQMADSTEHSAID
jgi:CheY-like chemotaxis protein